MVRLIQIQIWTTMWMKKRQPNGKDPKRTKQILDMFKFEVLHCGKISWEAQASGTHKLRENESEKGGENKTFEGNNLRKNLAINYRDRWKLFD